MKLGIVAGVFAPASIEDVLDQVVRHGFEAVEFPTGNYGGTPCFDLDSVVGSPSAIRGLRAAVEARGLTISALSCQGNPLHPREEIAGCHHDVLMKTLQLAAGLGVDVVNVFSGCPGSGDGSRYPSWVSCAWPPDFLEVLEWQWREKLIPYWHAVVDKARRLGVPKLAMEPMPGFTVYNTRTLLELRNAVGPEVGANLDPSHLFWQGMIPVQRSVSWVRREPSSTFTPRIRSSIPWRWRGMGFLKLARTNASGSEAGSSERSDTAMPPTPGIGFFWISGETDTMVR